MTGLSFQGARRSRRPPGATVNVSNRRQFSCFAPWHRQ